MRSGRRSILPERPEFLDQPVVQFVRPLAPQKSDYLLSSDQELRAISPLAVRAVGECDPFRVACVPAVFSRTDLLGRGF